MGMREAFGAQRHTHLDPEVFLGLLSEVLAVGARTYRSLPAEEAREEAMSQALFSLR